jgi:hypothetical protein
MASRGFAGFRLDFDENANNGRQDFANHAKASPQSPHPEKLVSTPFAASKNVARFRYGTGFRFAGSRNSLRLRKG